MRKQRDIVWIVSGDRVTTVKNGWTDGMGRFPLSVHYNERTKMPKTYSVKAYYKDFFFYEVEAESAEEAKEIALANQQDWEKPDETWLELAGNAPIVTSVKEV